MQKINFYLFRFFALVKPHPLRLGALRGKRLDTDRKVGAHGVVEPCPRYTSEHLSEH